MTIKLQIRAAQRTDVAALVALEDNSFDGDRLSRRSFRRLLASPSAALLVARAEAMLAGYVLVFFRRGSAIGRLYSIAVDSRCRGRGVAGQLLAAAEDAVRARNCRLFRLEVRTDNVAAIQLYERLGFVVWGQIPGYYDDGCSALGMQKVLVE